MCYFNYLFRFPRIVIDTICHALKDPKFGYVDLVVGTGMSGTLVLLPVSIQSGIPFAAVRKKIDISTSPMNGGSHSLFHEENVKRYKECRYLIIDDLTDSQRTIDHICNEMSNLLMDCRCVGIVLYQNFAKTITVKKIHDIPVTCLNKDILDLSRMDEYKEALE